MNGVNRREKTAIYIGGVFVMAIIVWAMVAALRADGLLDYKLGFALVAVLAWDLMRRRMRKTRR